MDVVVNWSWLKAGMYRYIGFDLHVNLRPARALVNFVPSSFSLYIIDGERIVRLKARSALPKL